MSEPSQPVTGDIDVSLNYIDSSFFQDLYAAHFVVSFDLEDTAKTGLAKNFLSIHLGLGSVPGLTSIEQDGQYCSLQPHPKFRPIKNVPVDPYFPSTAEGTRTFPNPYIKFTIHFPVVADLRSK